MKVLDKSKASVELNQEYWDEFYKSNNLEVPSQFCAFVATDIPPGSTVLEMGSGNGRDALYFLNQGFQVTAIDLSEQAILHCRSLAAKRGIKYATFNCVDLSNKDKMLETINAARKASAGALIFYSRFVMHSLTDFQQEDFLSGISQGLVEGDKLYFEFRSSEDEKLAKHFGGHYRRYISSKDFCNALAELCRVKITYSITGQGMAKYLEEDPFVCRVIAEKI